MKRILIVTHWYFPRNVPRAFRAKELVNEFRNRGFLVDLVVGDYKQFILHKDYNQNDFEKRMLAIVILLSSQIIRFYQS